MRVENTSVLYVGMKASCGPRKACKVYLSSDEKTTYCMAMFKEGVSVLVDVETITICR